MDRHFSARDIQIVASTLQAQEQDILEFEVKWALESITMNKASGGDGIPVDSSEGDGILFQIVKDDVVKMPH